MLVKICTPNINYTICTPINKILKISKKKKKKMFKFLIILFELFHNLISNDSLMYNNWLKKWMLAVRDADWSKPLDTV